MTVCVTGTGAGFTPSASLAPAPAVTVTGTGVFQFVVVNVSRAGARVTRVGLVVPTATVTRPLGMVLRATVYTRPVVLSSCTVTARGRIDRPTVLSWTVTGKVTAPAPVYSPLLPAAMACVTRTRSCVASASAAAATVTVWPVFQSAVLKVRVRAPAPFTVTAPASWLVTVTLTDAVGPTDSRTV